MNRAENRRQRQHAKKSQRKVSAKGRPTENPLDIQQSLDLALRHHGAGELSEAESLYRQILKADPDNPVALHLLGVTAHQMGNADMAVELITKALALKPDFAEARSNLGNLLREAGQREDAVASFRKALALKPDFADAHNNLGLALQNLGRLEDAVASFRKALALKPDYAYAHNNLGLALQDLGRPEDALASYREALALKPDYAEAHNNLGNALKDQGMLEDAVASFRKAISVKPDLAEAHNNLGNALKDQGTLEDAVASFRKALALKPDYPEAHSNLLFTFKYMANPSSPEIKVEAEKFGERASAKANPFCNWKVQRSAEKRLRVGLVSGDLRNHVVGRFLESLLGNIDKSRMEFIAYSNSPLEDPMTARLKPHFARWHRAAGLGDDHLSGLIHEEAIDILIDLSNHSAHNRLPMFAFKPAPVQATWLGLFATTGVPGMDYIIADPHIAPPHEADHFTEEIWPLAETWLSVTPPEVSIEPAGLPALDNGYVSFGCFNNLAKMNDTVVALWARILREVPDSRLFLKAVNGDLARRNTLSRFSAHGIGPERLVMEEKSPPLEYYAAYNRVDISLDTFPYNGGMTSLDSLWMAVPVLTRRSERVGSHLGESIAVNAGLADWIAQDDEDYVAKAVALTSDFSQLAKLRNGLRKQVLASPLYDVARFARHFEDALRGMWRKACDALPEAPDQPGSPEAPVLNTSSGGSDFGPA